MSAAPLALAQVLRPMIRRRRFVLAMAVLGVAIGLLHYFVSDPRFESKLTVLPPLQNDGAILGMAGDLAQIAGLSLGGRSDPTLFYRDILMSDLVLDKLLDLSVPGGLGSVGAGLGGTTTAEDREKAIRRLRRMMSISRDNRSRTVEVRIQASSRELASALADSLGSSLNQYLGMVRRQDSSAQHEFLASELSSVLRTLESLESKLADFKSRNRLIAQSPDLQREETILRRDIMVKEAVLVEIQKQVELAGMGMRRHVPMTRQLEPARTYRRPVYPKLSQSLLLGLGIVAVLSVMWVYGRQTLEYCRSLSAPDE
jgi:uncharacterized protein involved in exopolysaccharide biosynthesis